MVGVASFFDPLRHVLEKAQLEHFKLVACAGRVYSLPVDAFADIGCGAQMMPLLVKLGFESAIGDGLFRPGVALPRFAATHEDDEGIVDVVDAGVEQHVAQRVFFSIIDSTPSKARVVPLPPGVM